MFKLVEKVLWYRVPMRSGAVDNSRLHSVDASEPNDLLYAIKVSLFEFPTVLATIRNCQEHKKNM